MAERAKTYIRLKYLNRDSASLYVFLALLLVLFSTFYLAAWALRQFKESLGPPVAIRAASR